MMAKLFLPVQIGADIRIVTWTVGNDILAKIIRKGTAIEGERSHGNQ